MIAFLSGFVAQTISPIAARKKPHAKPWFSASSYDMPSYKAADGAGYHVKQDIEQDRRDDYAV